MLVNVRDYRPPSDVAVLVVDGPLAIVTGCSAGGRVATTTTPGLSSGRRRRSGLAVVVVVMLMLLLLMQRRNGLLGQFQVARFDAHAAVHGDHLQGLLPRDGLRGFG
uniref:(northern house mosquito) hypothetical protein n=1 Tax=Culex pipiens TaxID=7175 RepID=A0A8D8FUQ4_CULPI